MNVCRYSVGRYSVITTMYTPDLMVECPPVLAVLTESDLNKGGLDLFLL